MKKTLTVEIFLMLFFTALGVMGAILLGNDMRVWLLPVYTAMILLSYLLRWEFIISSGVLMPLILNVYRLAVNQEISVENLIILILELIITGLIIYFSYNKWDFDIHPSLVVGIIVGRFMGGIMSALINAIFSNNVSVNLINYTMDSVTTDIKGIALQLAFIPLIILLFNKMFVKSGKR